MADYEAAVSEFPKPLSSIQRAELRSHMGGLSRAEGMLRGALETEQGRLAKIEAFVEETKREIAVLRGEPFQSRAAQEAPGNGASTTAAAPAAPAGKEEKEKEKEEGISGATDEVVGSKRKREAPDDGTTAQAEEAEAVKTAESGATAPMPDTPPASASRPETQPQPAPQPAPQRQRATIGKNTGVFASLKGFLQGAKKEQLEHSSVMKQRQEIAERAKIESKQQTIVAQQATIAQHREAVASIRAKLEAVAEQKKKLGEVLQALMEHETRYASAFSLEATGPLYSVFFRPAEHTEKTLRMVTERIRVASSRYLDFRADVDLFLAAIENRRAEQQQQQQLAAAGARTSDAAVVESEVVLGDGVIKRDTTGEELNGAMHSHHQHRHGGKHRGREGHEKQPASSSIFF